MMDYKKREEAKMTKVCHLTSAHKPGDVRIFYKECASLAEAGYEVYLVQRGESGEELGVRVVGVGMPSGGGRLERMTSFAKKVYEAALAVDADIYHLHDPELLPYGLKLKKRGKKVIFDSHEVYVEQIREKAYLPRWIRGLIAGVYGMYQSHVFRKIDAVVSPCPHRGQDPYATLCRRSVFADNYPLLQEMYDKYDPEVVKLPRSICYVGGLTYERGITHLVKAADKADCTLYLAGPFSPPEYEQEVLSMPGSEHVCYLGQLSRQEVREAVQRCQIGMATILNVGQYNMGNNLPTKTYEYMSLALPVVLTRSKHPYNEETTNEWGFGVCVDPENTEEMAEVICDLLEHPEKMVQMGENGRRAVKEKFNWGTQEKKLFALYEDILRG